MSPDFSNLDSSRVAHCLEEINVYTNLDSSRGAHCLEKINIYTNFTEINIQGDQKFSVHMMITIHKVTSNVQNVPGQYPGICWH
jgi:hypothetical protein